MAQNLTIPKEMREGLEKIHALDPKTLNKLVKVLKSEKAALHIATLVPRLVEKLGDSKKHDTGEIVYTILGLYSGTTSTKMDAAEFIEGVSNSEDLNIPYAERSEFRAKLTQLLGVKALEITAKALNVFIDHERTFQDARIITDIRPIFEKDPNQTPENGVVVHVLKIVYKEGKHVKEFYVALDSNDLKIMQQVTERAVDKDKSSVDFLQKSGIHVLS